MRDTADYPVWFIALAILMLAGGVSPSVLIAMMKFEGLNLSMKKGRYWRSITLSLIPKTIMRIFTVFVAVTLFGLPRPIDGLTRPVDSYPLDELWAKADLVAVIRPLATTNTSDQLKSAGPKYGPRNPKNYQGLNTRFEVVIAMKTSEELRGWNSDELTSLHFRYAPSRLEFNGGMFAYFHFAPAEFHLFVKGDSKYPVCRDKNPTYLAFLKQAPDGRFRAVTGHYDSETSFRIIATPMGGAGRYALKVDSENVQRSNGEILKP